MGRAPHKAMFEGADLLVLPELAACGGYPPRDLLERRWFVEKQWALVQSLAPISRDGFFRLFSNLSPRVSFERVGC